MHNCELGVAADACCRSRRCRCSGKPIWRVRCCDLRPAVARTAALADARPRRAARAPQVFPRPLLDAALDARRAEREEGTRELREQLRRRGSCHAEAINAAFDAGYKLPPAGEAGRNSRLHGGQGPARASPARRLAARFATWSAGVLLRGRALPSARGSSVRFG